MYYKLGGDPTTKPSDNVAGATSLGEAPVTISPSSQEEGSGEHEIVGDATGATSETEAPVATLPLQEPDSDVTRAIPQKEARVATSPETNHEAAGVESNLDAPVANSQSEGGSGGSNWSPQCSDVTRATSQKEALVAT